mgnify:CR=1 FL=1
MHNYSRHGIFVGNCERLIIDSNELDLNRMTRANKVQIDGIKVWGFLGRKGTITNNDIFSTTRPSNSYNTGIKVKNLKQDKKIIISSAFESVVGRSAVALLASLVKGEHAHGLSTASFIETDLANDIYTVNNGGLYFNHQTYPPSFDGIVL